MTVLAVAARLAWPVQGVDAPELDVVVRDGLTTEDWIVAGATVAAFVVVGVLAHRIIERLVRRTDSEGQIARFVGRVVQNVLIVVGLVYALTSLGVQIGPLIGALGISGIAIAFALTAVLENVFASALLKTRRPIRVRDQITTNEHSGTVQEINFRAVVLRNFDGESVVLPSSMVMNSPIVNHTINGLRRTVLTVGVAYGTELRAAQQVILDAVATVDDVRETPAPQAWVTTFNDSSIDFDVRYWHEPGIATVFRTRSEVAMAIKAAFDAEGIEIPFPQRVVTMNPEEEVDGGRSSEV